MRGLTSKKCFGFFFFPLYKVYRKTLIFFRKKNDIKGQNKSLVFLTKIKALLFVQEQSWNLLSWWRLARGIVLHVRLVPTVHQQKQTISWCFVRSFITSVLLSCIRTQSSSPRHKPVVKVTRHPSERWLCLSFLRPSLGPDPPAEKHWRPPCHLHGGGSTVNAAEHKKSASCTSSCL